MNFKKQELLSLLPPRLRPPVAACQAAQLLELRLRPDRPLTLVTLGGIETIGAITVQPEDLRFCVNTASRYSPWNATTIRDGYLTAPGGHRIGLCGAAAGEGIQSLTSLCIRVAKDLPGIGDKLPLRDSTLILGPPGSGKTTLLRDLIRRLSNLGPESVAVADERSEIFPFSSGALCFDSGPNTDVLSGKPKSQAVDHLLRSMGPGWIAMDEITAAGDCDTLIRAGWCGIRLLATAHARDVNDLRTRPIYKPLVESGLFHHAIVLHPDKTSHHERI